MPGLGVPGYAAGRYEGVLRSVLLAYKNRGAYRYERHLGRRLAGPLLNVLEAEYRLDARRHRVALVPLPSRRRSERERGFRHVEVIARRALRTLGVPGSVVPALRATRGRTGQVGLGPLERERNARRVRVRRGAIAYLTRVPVVLVDDVSTTGATLRVATEVLEASGVRVMGAVTLCLAERRDAPQKLEWNLTGERG
ncbi:phosphoribosyl transferase-like protein [Leucobacter komagatae]|uniref:Phosphoribosyl transferase-like protein n=1 Tax=Leucobacter komagatae TaxID=55969 RepID=A0A542Y6U1_9MICO|nr:phosphoribosyl transferase-like protein [Leucobacter komagatae]